MYENIDITPFLTREYVFRHVKPRLYSKGYYDSFYGANRMFGKYLDMLVGYQVDVPELTTEDRNVSFPIMLEQLDIIGNTVEELHNNAILNLENDEYIVPLSKDFPIDEEYLMYVIEKMVEHGMVEKVNIMKAWGGDVIKIDYSKMRITVEGIDYLRDNSVMRKVAETLQEAIPIFSLFQ